MWEVFDFYLPGFLGAKLDEWSTAHEESEHVRHHVIDHHHQDWHDEPDQSWSLLWLLLLKDNPSLDEVEAGALLRPNVSKGSVSTTPVGGS